MRLVQFVQVVLLLALCAYLLLIALENPGPVRLPLPLGRGELLLPLGTTVTLFTLLGVLYAALLLLPPLWQVRRRRRREARERAALESRLTATLQARLGSVPPAPAPGTTSAPRLENA